MTETLNTRVAIVGGGITGLATASWLVADHGIDDVVVLDLRPELCLAAEPRQVLLGRLRQLRSKDREATSPASQGSGPRTLRKVAGLKVPAPTSRSYGCWTTHPLAAQKASSLRITS